jgi:hypothetical protein
MKNKIFIKFILIIFISFNIACSDTEESLPSEENISVESDVSDSEVNQTQETEDETETSASLSIEKIEVEDLIQYQQNAITIVDEVQKTESLPDFNILAFEQIESENWDILAVKKVLNIFAFGGFATDTQIKKWSELSPNIAIQEMLTFEQYNSLLSPVTSDDIEFYLEKRDIKSMSLFWSSDHKDNPISETNRARYNLNTSYDSLQRVWAGKVNRRGFNPFREKIVFFETNYHMALNQSNGIEPQVMFQNYYNIATALEHNLSYDKVLAIGALSAGIAYQYGHNRNKFDYGKFRGNEDFAREYHQLFFGIFGDYNNSIHEFETIRNTAKALTDMTGERNEVEDQINYRDVELAFNSDSHYPTALTILEQSINGNNAKEKIFDLSKKAILHTESENNLPVYIISTLADDNLTSEAKSKIIESWKKMGEQKSLLRFLQAYAVSKSFHSDFQFKYKTSVERNMHILNKITIDNNESYRDLYNMTYSSSDENCQLFKPIHDVFGGQRSLEAIDSPDVFRNVYNKSTRNKWSLLRNQITEDDVVVWQKNFEKIIPSEIATVKDANTTVFHVKDVAFWLWDFLIQDGGKNFGTLEKAHVYALLNGYDLGNFMNESNPTRVYSSIELESLEYRGKVEDGGNAIIFINSSDISKRLTANQNIMKAVAFIIATPYIYISK